MYRIAVFNGDESYIDGPKHLPPSTNSSTYQPLIPQVNLTITLMAVFVREISRSMTINVMTGGNGMQLVRNL